VSPNNILGGSRSGLSDVLGKSQPSPGGVSGPDQFPVGFDDVLTVVQRFENVTLKLKKWFTVLNIGNHFTEIKKDFFSQTGNDFH
jgi:hypothetical protein